MLNFEGGSVCFFIVFGWEKAWFWGVICLFFKKAKTNSHAKIQVWDEVGKFHGLRHVHLKMLQEAWICHC